MDAFVVWASIFVRCSFSEAVVLKRFYLGAAIDANVDRRFRVAVVYDRAVASAHVLYGTERYLMLRLHRSGPNRRMSPEVHVLLLSVTLVNIRLVGVAFLNTRLVGVTLENTQLVGPRQVALRVGRSVRRDAAREIRVRMLSGRGSQPRYGARGARGAAVREATVVIVVDFTAVFEMTAEVLVVL